MFLSAQWAAEFMKMSDLDPPSRNSSSHTVNVPRNASVLHKRNPWGETLLHRACKRGDLQTVRALIQAGISVNVKDHAGWTALHEAVAEGSEPMVEELLKAGADSCARSQDGVTPLHDAVHSGNQEVVKLLLQFGSNTCDRTLGGISALDLAKEEQMKRLLLTFRDSLVSAEKPHEASEQHKHPGRKSSEAQCHKQLCSQRNFSPNTQPRESGDRASARELAGIQRREKHAKAKSISQTESFVMVLEELWKKQTEMSTRFLSAPRDADRFGAALTRIQNQLSELLDIHLMERDQLTRKQRTVSASLWQRVLKPRLVSLASRQRKLVEILQKQVFLVEAFVKKKAQLSAQPMNRQQKAGERHQKDLIKPAPRSAASRRSAHCQSENRSLSVLMQGGLVNPGCALHLFIKPHLHCAYVLADASLKDLQGRVHPSPEHWLGSVLGGKVPVSSAYTWDKVMLRGEPLSSYTLDQESHANTAPDNHSPSTSAVEDLSSGDGSLKRLMRVRTIHLMEDEEFLPNAIVDPLWEKLINEECSDSW
ncbi:ankyrin repeat domain-containing protein 31-like isoform X2 [Halichoeres trimaculatus]|uniref:ankyrin repeat domain-containing protein 31-like isoform X2 n=1 Tax=Halichoeres trimaculatus TaxID=147232 RepID=UPI003D9F3705